MIYINTSDKIISNNLIDYITSCTLIACESETY